MIKFTAVNKIYPNGNHALKNTSFELENGEMAFLTGHSGAGKSTLLRLITMIEHPTNGEIILGNTSLTKIRRQHIAHLRREIGFIFQDHKLLMQRTVFDNIALPLMVCGSDYEIAKKRVRAALGKVGLSGKEHRYPYTLSAGEQQRVGIARAVINRPRILLADEPTGNLDTDLSKEIINIFYNFHQVGVTVLVATHDERQIQRFNIRTITLHAGCILTDTAR